jgi:PadR family transcriptional regulator, regulatory protein PadR
MPIPVERDLLLGTLDILVLRALTRQPMHGYAIARFIRDGSGDAIRVLDGALYTALHRLEARGCVESDWGLSSKGKRAKFYRMTVAGRRALKAENAAWDRYVAAVAGVMRAIPEEA